jgi:hypothetical protein
MIHFDVKKMVYVTLVTYGRGQLCIQNGLTAGPAGKSITKCVADRFFFPFSLSPHIIPRLISSTRSSRFSVSQQPGKAVSHTTLG